MIAGMLPMALGLGEGGEQIAPLGRAVIGGLLGARSPRCSCFPRFCHRATSRPDDEQLARSRRSGERVSPRDLSS